MKSIFLFAILTIFTISCKKDVSIQDTLPSTNVSQISNSYANKNSHLNPIRVRVIWAAEWVSLYQNCISGYWYCWEITVEPDAKEYVDINDKEEVITFGIDYNSNPDYHKQFIQNDEFYFPQDTYINSSIVKAAIGIGKEIVVKKGLYPLEIKDGILIITAPYTIID